MKTKTRRPHYGLAAIVFCCAAAALASPWLTGRVTTPWDAKAHFYPQLAFLARAFAEGRGFGWTPNVFAGWPQIADPQSLIFAPAYLLAAALTPAPTFVLADAIVFAALAAGGLALIAYFRDQGWGAAGGLTAALAFAFGGAAAWRIQHVGQAMSLAWFAVAIWALSRALGRGSVRWGLAAGAAAGCMVAGRDQVAWLQTYVLIGFVVWRVFDRPGVWANMRRFLAPLSGGVAAGLATAAAPVAFTLALAAQSNRPDIVFSEVVKGSLHPGALLTALAANLYGVDGPIAEFWGPPSAAWGETGLFLARNMGVLYVGALPVAALLAGRWRRAEGDALYWALAALFLLVYALGQYTPLFAYLHRLPGAGLWRRPADAVFPLCAVLAILGGFAVHTIEAAGAARLGRALAMLTAAFAVAAWVAVEKNRGGAAVAPLALAGALFFGALVVLRWLAAHGAAQPRRALILVGLALTLDLAVSNKPNESTAASPAEFDMLRPATSNATIALLKQKTAETAAPDRRDRVELAGLGFAWPNAGLVHGLDNLLGYNPVRLDLFVAFTNAQDHVALPEQRAFSNAFASYRSIAADLLGLRFIATGVPVEQIDPRLKPGDLTFLARTADGYVYENPRAFPRVWVASETRAADFAALMADGRWPDVDYRRVVLLETAHTPPRPAVRPASARLARYGNVEVVVDLDAPDGGYLVLADIYHPWWRATVDGAPTPVLRADGVLRAVELPPGARQARFEFAPWAGLWAQTRQAVAASVFGGARGP